MITTVKAPQVNANDEKVELVAWHIEDGARVEAGQDVADVETAKTAVTIEAEVTGYIKPLVKKGAVVKVGAPLYLCASTLEELKSAALPQDVSSAANSNAASSKVQKFGSSSFSKSALKLIEEHGLSKEDFADAGLVTAQMVLEKAGKGRGTAAKPSAVKTAVLPSGPQTSRNESVSLAKQAEINSLSRGESGNINSMLSVYFDSAPVRERLQVNGSFEGSIQPVILFEIAQLLKQWPQFTAYFENDSIHYYDRVDLGIAFDLGKGLKVVTVKSADTLKPLDFFEKTLDIGMRYLENDIRTEELAGSTMTITDLSGMNVLHFHPLINGHQSAIIGLGGDANQPGYPMSLNMTFDHRVTNGREVAVFLNELRSRIVSYAAVEETAVQPAESFDSLFPPASEIRCDRCAIDLHKYYQQFSRDACMMAYFREDGSLGSICHRCAGAAA